MHNIHISEINLYKFNLPVVVPVVVADLSVIETGASVVAVSVNLKYKSLDEYKSEPREDNKKLCNFTV